MHIQAGKADADRAPKRKQAKDHGVICKRRGKVEATEREKHMRNAARGAVETEKGLVQAGDAKAEPSDGDGIQQTGQKDPARKHQHAEQSFLCRHCSRVTKTPSALSPERV